MDPLNPITPPTTALPSRRVPAVDRLPRVSREGDRPPQEGSERRAPRPEHRPAEEGEEGGEGHIDIRV